MSLLLTALFTLAVLASVKDENVRLKKTHQALLTALRSLSSEAPVCDTNVIMALLPLLSTECTTALMSTMQGTSSINTMDLTCEECACYMEVTPEAFLQATGVSSDSCGIGSGNSFLDEQNNFIRMTEIKRSRQAEFCSAGIRNNKICCNSSCGSCAGSGCGLRPGRASQCCKTTITDNGRYCSSPFDVACIIPEVEGCLIYSDDQTCETCVEGYTRGQWDLAGLCRKCKCASVDPVTGDEQCNCATCTGQGYCTSCKDGYTFDVGLQPHLERCTP